MGPAVTICTQHRRYVCVMHASPYTPCQTGHSVSENKLHLCVLHLSQRVYLYAFFENQEQF
jgi:hypothetical protein